MDYEDWFETYDPLINHLNNDRSVPFDGLMYETYGEEYNYIKEQPSNKVWTLVDDSEGGLAIIPGHHYVNRLGYFVCLNEWADETLEVTL
jgi:hypothetical protein